MIIQKNKILKKMDFKNEKELQTYVENNMKAINESIEQLDEGKIQLKETEE